MIDKLPPLALPIAPEATETIAQPGGSQLVQVRLIRAPRERVWTAWTEPDQLGQWWGPAGFSLTTELFEFRVGGHWVFTMHGPDPDPASRNPGAPRDFPNHVVWDRIERGGGSGDGAGAAGPWVLGYRHVQADSVESALFTSVVTFEERDGHTLLTWRADFGSNALREQLDRDYGAARGGRETTARLAAHAEGAGLDETGRADGFRLVLSRILPVRRETVWRAWTEPSLLMRWFCPRPYAVDRCDLDLRAGGRFFTHMVGPDGWQGDNDGCYLEVVPGERLAFTDLLLADWRPAPDPSMRFTATVVLEDAGGGRTKYTAIVRHATAQGRDAHAKMGFHDGWGTATDQLVALAAGF